jgi:hypothetical protein
MNVQPTVIHTAAKVELRNSECREVCKSFPHDPGKLFIVSIDELEIRMTAPVTQGPKVIMLKKLGRVFYDTTRPGTGFFLLLFLRGFGTWLLGRRPDMTPTNRDVTVRELNYGDEGLRVIGKRKFPRLRVR